MGIRSTKLGIFYPQDIEDMRRELGAASTQEDVVERQNRAILILENAESRKTRPRLDGLEQHVADLRTFATVYRKDKAGAELLVQQTLQRAANSAPTVSEAVLPWLLRLMREISSVPPENRSGDWAA